MTQKQWKKLSEIHTNLQSAFLVQKGTEGMRKAIDSLADWLNENNPQPCDKDDCTDCETCEHDTGVWPYGC